MSQSEALLAVCEARLILIRRLAPYVEEQMRIHIGNNWLDYARNRRDPSAPSAGIDEAVSYQELDDYMLLRIMGGFWSDVFRKAGMKKAHRSLVATVLAARNSSAHPSVQMMSSDHARHYLIAIEDLLLAIGGQEECEEVRAIRKRVEIGGESRDFSSGGDIAVLEQRILDQISQEFENRSRAGQDTGQAMMSHFEGQSEQLQRIENLLMQLNNRTEDSKSSETRARIARPTQTESVRNLRWDIRKNPSGTYSAWRMNAHGRPAARLALPRAEILRILGDEIINKIDDLRGQWFTLDESEEASLNAEAKKRIGDVA